MSFLRTHLSAAVAWGMIPLAVWAGMPSTGCVCANGRLKLLCGHRAGSRPVAHGASCDASCCGGAVETVGNAEMDRNHESDCCAGGHCCHGTRSDESRIGSQACCKPIASVPGVAAEVVNVPSEHSAAAVTVVEQVGALVQPSPFADVAEFDTGPPLDRVIVFRSLLI